MSTTDDLRARFASALDQQQRQKRAEIKPLATDTERAALDIARYKSHVRAIIDSDATVRAGVQQLQDLDAQRGQLISAISVARDNVILFVAEAREQAGLLMTEHGLTQEQINSVATVPESIAAVDIETLVPMAVKIALAGDELKKKG